MSEFIFIHGLCTYGDDELHFGPARMGRLDRHLVESFARRQTSFLSVNGIGFGSPEEQAETALPQIQSSTSRHLVLLGHSMGGLTARVLQPRLEKAGYRVDIITWGTPHHGTSAAIRNDSRSVKKMANWLGYSLEMRAATFKHCTPDALLAFNKRYPFRQESQFSLLCDVPLRYTTPLLFALRPSEPSDGFIKVESQSFGQILDRFRLDHFSALGYCDLHPLPSVRTHSRAEFNRLVESVLSFRHDDSK